MKKIIILRGNSGSGKTTIAKELQKQFGRNTMLISQDGIRRNRAETNLVRKQCADGGVKKTILMY